MSSLSVRSAAGLAHNPVDRGLGGGLEGGHESEPGIMPVSAGCVLVCLTAGEGGSTA